MRAEAGDATRLATFRVSAVRFCTLPDGAFAESFFDSLDDFEAGGVLGCQTEFKSIPRAENGLGGEADRVSEKRLTQTGHSPKR